MKNTVKSRRIGLMVATWEQAQRRAAAEGFHSTSEWAEWVFLHQLYSRREAAEVFAQRRKQGVRINKEDQDASAK
jgi:hypothetical protein